MTNKGATGMVPVKGTIGLVDPFFRTFQDRFNRLFGEGFGTLMDPLLEENWSIRAWAPKCDIFETANEIVVKVELPDMKKEEIKVSIDNNVLTLSAEHNEEKEEKDKGRVIRQERRYGSYMRSFTLGSGVDEKAITATFADGVLTLDIPKAQPHAPQSKSIPIR